MNNFDILLKKNKKADDKKLYDVENMYIGDLVFAIDRKTWLKTCLFERKTAGGYNIYRDIESLTEYAGYHRYEVGNKALNTNSLTSVLVFFSKNQIPYEKEMTEKEMFDLIYPERVGVFRINELYVGTIDGIIDDKQNLKTLKKGIFLKKVFNNKTIYIDIETNKDYPRIVDVKQEVGNLIFNTLTYIPLKQYFVENGIIYEEIMEKDDILNKYNGTLNNSSLDYTSGINIDEDSIIQIEMCGSKNELIEVLKSINKHNVDTKIISNKPIERVK